MGATRSRAPGWGVGEAELGVAVHAGDIPAGIRLEPRAEGDAVADTGPGWAARCHRPLRTPLVRRRMGVWTDRRHTSRPRARTARSVVRSARRHVTSSPAA